MRILLAHNSTYYPAHGGGDISNRLLIEALAARGHECLVVCRTASHGAEAHRELLAELAHRDVAATVEEPGIVRFPLNDVEIHTATETPHLRDYFTRQIGAFQPDVILASTDDSAQVLLHAALSSGVPVVYMARATIALPFGPDCAFPGIAKTDALRRAAGVVGVSGYVADYIRRWSGIPAEALPISFMGRGPFANLGRFENEFVTLVNPCVVKGIDIFTALADALPDTRFAAVPTWGTNDQDFAKLHARSNITVLPAADDIDRILERTRVLLVPSVWAEARSRVVVEAMLRGVPVIASDTGGLPEAKLGVPYVLPVNPVTGYAGKLDAKMVPVAETPAQDLAPWIEAVQRLTSEEAHWQQIAKHSRRAAHRYLEETLRIEPFEAFLEERAAAKPQLAPPPQTTITLSEDKRRLLALRLRDQWLAPGILDPNGPNLLCFPYAGASPAVYRSWRDKLPVLTVRYPAKAESVAEVINTLMEQIAPKLRGRFVFFGHSMGAGISYEFARALRRHGLPLPAALIISAATAPQLRTTVSPDPTEEELMGVLARIHGPSASQATLRTYLARFGPDVRLYRRYLYSPEPPLDIPIFAYGGKSDIAVPPARLELWKEQTSRRFQMRLFDGGHMYLDQSVGALLNALREDLHELLPG
jgi:surfactin synthase thioesterase subunit/glycosyltransferase involved in cell wall biosynthesis